jgi:hypothetical protein
MSQFTAAPLGLALLLVPLAGFCTGPQEAAASAIEAASPDASRSAAGGAVGTEVQPRSAADGTEISFSDFFERIGDRGLEYKASFRQLDGQRVRIAGFMVRQETPTPGMFLLTSRPLSTHEGEYGFCDELPPATLHVLVPAAAEKIIPPAAGPVFLTGILSVGPRAEADGRNSVARLILDAVPATPASLTKAAATATAR